MATVNESAAIEAAKIAGESPEMDRVARQIAAEVRAGYAGHAVSGKIAASIQTGRTPGKKGVTDREVYSEADGVISAEFGHIAPNGRMVPGVHAFGKAAS